MKKAIITLSIICAGIFAVNNIDETVFVCFFGEENKYGGAYP